MALPNSASRELQMKFRADTKEVEKSIASMKSKISDLTEALRKKQKADVLETIELQAKAGIVPLSRLREEITKTVREAIKAKGSRAEFINDKDILQNIVRLRELKKEMEGVRVEAATMQQKIAAVGAGLQQAFLPLVGVSAAISATLAASSSSFANFERTLNTIKAVSETTQSELKELRDSSLNLGQETIFSNQQVAESYLELSRAGFTVRESLEAMPGLLQLAAAAGGDLAVASSVVSETMRAFGKSTSETQQFVDVLAQAANKSSADIADLGLAFKQVAPVARQTNQSVEDMAALLALLADNAVKGGDAGSDLRNIITRLVNPSKEAAAVMESLNISLQDAQGNVKPLPKLFKELNERFSGLSDASKAQASSILAGQENLKTFLILSGQAPKTIDAMVGAMNDADGAAMRMAETINQGLFSALEQLAGSFDTLKTVIGEALAPVISAVAQAFTNLNQVLSDNPGLAQFVAGAAAIAAGITAAGVAVGGFLLLFNPLSAALEAAGLSIGALVGAFAAATTAGGLATVGINNLSLEFIKANPIYKAAKEGISAIITAGAGLVDALGDAFNQVGRLITQLLKMGVALVSTESNVTILKIVLRALEGVVNIAAAAVRGFAQQIDQITTAAQIATVAVRGLAGALGELGKGNFDGAVREVEKATNTMQGLWNGLNNRTKERFRNMAGEAVKQLEKIQESSEKAAGTAVGTSGGTVVNFATEGKDAKKSHDETVRAHDQLVERIKKLEVELTGFQKGEFEKRKAEALRTYQEEIKQILDLGKKGKVSQEEIQRALTLAKNVYVQNVEKIQRDADKAFRENSRYLATLKAGILSLQAELSQGNPFDDITAEAQRASATINGEFAQAVDNLRQKLRDGGINQSQFEETKRLLEVERDLQLQNAKRIESEKKLIAVNALEQIQRETLTIRAEIAGDELTIERRKTQAIVADFENQLKLMRARLEAARVQLLLDPNNQDLQAGMLQIQAEIDRAQSQRDLSAKRGAVNSRRIESERQEAIVASVQKEIDIQGRKEGLLKRLQEEMNKLIALYEKELEVVGDSEDARSGILEKIKDLQSETSKLEAETSTFGKALRAIESINLPDNEFTRFFQSVAKGLQDLQIKFENFKKANPGEGLLDFLKTDDFKVAAASFGAQAVQTIGNQITKKMTGAKGALSKAFVGGLSGALGGFAVAGPVGALVGGAIGAVSGATSASGGKFDAKAGLKGLPFGLLGFAIAGFVGGAKKVKEEQKKLEKAKAFFQSLLSVVDQNDLGSINDALVKAKTYKTGGGAAFQEKVATVAQLKAAQKQRQQAIDDAIRSLKLQNEALANQLRITDTQPIENLNIERVNALAQLQDQTDQSLRQFKDSVEATELIMKQHELSKQLILKAGAEDIIDAAIEAQNRIREYRAETAVAEARAAGDTLGIINAELQARLIALDNEIASFKGAEEEKTEFLKAQAAKREQILKEANRSVDDLLREGLNILNEGLVVAQTKQEGQTKRLQKLFGNLNPLGLIQADGNLVAQNVNVEQVAPTFILQGIQDAQALIEQLKDPLIQLALRNALNQAIART